MARATRLPAEVTVGLPVVPVTSTPREEGTGPSRCAASKPSAEEWQTLVDLKNKLAALETRLVDWSQRLEAREAALDDSPAHAEQASRLREHEQKMQRETAALRRREAACAEREAHVIALQQQREEEYDAWVADVEAQRAKWSAMHVRRWHPPCIIHPSVPIEPSIPSCLLGHTGPSAGPSSLGGLASSHVANAGS